MNRKALSLVRYFVLVLLLASTACVGAAPAPTVAPTITPVPPTATATLKPTATPRPSATPNLAATQEMEAVRATVQKYVDSGYLPSNKGNIYPLEDNVREMAQKNFLDYDFAGYETPIKDFAAWADLEWESAAPVAYPEYSGCGFGFRVTNQGHSYTAMVTNDRILITWCDKGALGNKCGILGKTSGTGKVKLENPAKVHFSLVVNGTSAYALVNEELIGQYTLFQDKIIDPGFFLYSIVSGTNKDYGTRCTRTNGKLWVPED